MSRKTNKGESIEISEKTSKYYLLVLFEIRKPEKQWARMPKDGPGPLVVSDNRYP